MKTNLAWWKKGFRDGIPICLGYIAVSFTFGIMAKRSGLSWFQAALMSAVNYTSAGQFAALDLIEKAAPYLELAITQLIINLRYALMSCSLSQKLAPNVPFYHRFLIAFGNTDEVFGVSAACPGRLYPAYSYGVFSAALPGWVIGTLLGVISGSLLPPRIISALSVALYGMFLAIILPSARTGRKMAGIIAVSMLASLMFSIIPVLSLISSGIRIILLTLLIAGGAAVLFPVKEVDEDER